MLLKLRPTLTANGSRLDNRKSSCPSQKIIAFASGLANAWFNASVIAKVEQEGKVALAEQIKIKEKALKLEAETKNQFESYQKSAGQKIAALQEVESLRSRRAGTSVE